MNKAQDQSLKKVEIDLREDAYRWPAEEAYIQSVGRLEKLDEQLMYELP
jgi:hypothetical protein